MTDRELEQRLRAWYEAEVGSTEAAPVGLRESVATIPVTTPAPLRPLSGRRRFTLLAVAALIVVGGALGRRFRFPAVTPVVTPAPSPAAIAPGSPSPTETGPETPSPTVSLRNGATIAFIRNVDKPRSCSSFRKTTTCPTPRLWIVGSDGRGAHELQPTARTCRVFLGWSPDGAHLLYTEPESFSWPTRTGAAPQSLDTGCSAPSPTTPLSCQEDSQVACLHDGQSIVFVRRSTDAAGSLGSSAIATMDLESGRVADLPRRRPPAAGARAGRRMGSRSCSSVTGTKPDGGPVPPVRTSACSSSTRTARTCARSARRRSPPSTTAWSPDGARSSSSRRIAMVPIALSFFVGDIYTMRPDGSRPAALDHGRAVRDRRPGRPTGGSCSAGVSRRRAAGCGRWIPTARTRRSDRVARHDRGRARKRPVHRPGLAAHRWSGRSCPCPGRRVTAVTVGPPAPTPSPTPTPDLAPGFSWTGSPTAGDGPARRDGHASRGRTRARHRRAAARQRRCTTRRPARSARPAPCRRSAAGETATLLHDGRVLFAGGYNCARRGGRDLGIGRALRPGDRHVQPDRLDGRPAPAAHGHAAGRRPRAHRRRSVGASPGDGRRDHARLVSDRRGRCLPGDRRDL